MLYNETINAARLALIDAIAQVREFDGELSPEEAANLLAIVLRLEGPPDLNSKSWHNPTLYDNVRRKLRWGI